MTARKGRTMTILLGLAALASATSVHAQPKDTMPAIELLDVARIVCPLNTSVEGMRAAARDAHMTQRESDTVIALCSMYHKGRADQALETIREMR